jgi:hypothetical protein
MNTIKAKSGFRCLMQAIGVSSPGVLALMRDNKRLYALLRLCGYRWDTKLQNWRFIDR